MAKSAAELKETDYAHPEVLVDTAWVAEQAGDPEVKLVEVGDVTSAYDSGRVKDARTTKPAGYKAGEPNKAIRALRDEVLRDLGKAGVVLVDVRSPKEFSGELLAPENLPQEGAQRGGHIPGAANIPWAQAVREDGTFKPAPEVEARYRAKGVTPDKAVIAYCRIGERSSHTWFVLNYLLGYPNVRNYDGSWTEWGSLIAAPIER